MGRVFIPGNMPGWADLERLYDEHANAVYAFLLNFTRSEADTRDLLQEVFLKLARSPMERREPRVERAFLLRLAHNAAIDLCRRRGAREKYHLQFGEETVPYFLAAGNIDEDCFRRALTQGLAELPEEQRAVVHLKLWEGMTFEEVASTLSISPNTAASRYRYGIDKLRERLRPLYDEIKK